MSRTKAPNLTRRRRIAIGRFKEKNLTYTFYELADEFHCTYNQARKAYEDYRSGKLSLKKPFEKKNSFLQITTLQAADELLERQYQVAMAELDAADNLLIEDRVKILNQLCSMRKMLQQLRMEAFIKRADSGVICILVRHFLPDASDEDVYKLYISAMEQWKIESK
jgi:hypothetical protein